MDFHVGQTVGEYTITAILGAGGMGHVYKVEHLLTKRIEAMKVLVAELASETQIKRFEREMRISARLSHPNIAALHNAIHSETRLILFMEFVEGRTLESILAAGRLPLDQGVGYIRQILFALRYAHQQGVVHRDVTPANVLVTAADEVKLADFGLSKSFGDSLLTNCGEVLGALPYLAPEQLKGTTQPDCRSDLYAAGAILYEHLTGKKPFGANRRIAPVLTDSEGEPAPPSQLDPGLAPGWDEIIRCALARDPGRRYQSADEFLEAIARVHSWPGAELPLSQLRTVGIGIAILAGFAVALVALPALKRFSPAPPISAPWKRLHIAPPALATSKHPAGISILRTTTPEVARRTAAPHSKPAPQAAALSVVKLNPEVKLTNLAETSTKELTAPIPSPDTAPPAAPPATEAKEPVTAESAEANVSQNPPPPKRGFWSKLNVFRKKKGGSDPHADAVR